VATQGGDRGTGRQNRGRVVVPPNAHGPARPGDTEYIEYFVVKRKLTKSQVKAFEI
jgi:hypothetical protein